MSTPPVRSRSARRSSADASGVFEALEERRLYAAHLVADLSLTPKHPLLLPGKFPGERMLGGCQKPPLRLRRRSSGCREGDAVRGDGAGLGVFHLARPS